MRNWIKEMQAELGDAGDSVSVRVEFDRYGPDGEFEPVAATWSIPTAELLDVCREAMEENER